MIISFKPNVFHIILILSSIVQPSLEFTKRCPEGCYSCRFKDEIEGKDPAKKSPLSRRSIKKKITLGMEVECQGCWHDRLGLKGCPPLRIRQENCLLYYKNGICVVCKKGFIPKTFADNGYLNSKCIKSREEAVVWGFYDHLSKTEFLRVCDGKFPISGNKYCREFYRGEFLSKRCLWGTGHRGCHKCFKCEKGYTSFFGVCRPSWRGIEGCIYADDDEFCSYCDHWSGYYMDYPGHCKKYEKLEKKKGALKKCVGNFLRFKNAVLMAYEMFN